MNCSSCGTENRPTAKFCAGCGSALSRACSSCAAELTAAAKFCDQCGTPVDAGSLGTAAQPSEATRKTITVMFADLVGSTAFGEMVDAEAARAEMGDYQQLAQEVIERHGGTVAKFIGDGVMAVFGVPDIAEDDAERAVRAGADLQTMFTPFAERIADVYHAEVGLRVGINTGEIVVAEDDDDMFGDALNTAARIEAECTPGRVLVGEQTWRLTRSRITYEVLGEVSVKGKGEAIATFQVVEAPDHEEDDDAGTPFVGRDAEIETLTGAIDRAIVERSPVLVTVVGSPGVGKTRLAAETRAIAAPHAESFDLRVDRAGTVTFGPIGELLRQVVDLGNETDPATVVSAIEAWIGEDGDAPTLAPLLATFVGATPARSTEESFWASRRLIEILAARRPTVIVVDDIQWAQPLFLDLLDHLIEWVDGPAALICLARPEIREIRPAMAEVGRRVTEVISLEGLGASATEELAAGLLGAALPQQLVDRLPESTDGNPLFVRELVRMLVDDGVVHEVDGRWELAIDPEAVEVPPTIQSLLASRVERMPADELRVVELASVVGSEFARGAVDALMSPVDRRNLDTILERLRRKEIIDPTGTYWGDEPILRFHHVLIRDASYRRILKQRRATLHQQVAEWTSGVADQFGGEYEITIGYHYEQAHEFRTQLGAVDADAEELGIRAAQQFRTAADRALAQDDLAAAGSLAQRALARLPKDAPERADLLVVACEAFFSSGNVRSGDPHLDELRHAALDDQRLTAWADAFAGHRAWLTEPNRLSTVEPQLDQAASLLDALDDQAGVAKARLIRAVVLARLGRVGDCESELDAALTAARAADDRRRVTAVLGAAPLAALWGPSPVARAGGRCLDIIRLLRITSASPMVEATSIRCQAVLEAMRGRFEQARELIGRARATVEELGLRHGILETDMFAGIIELFADDPVEAEPYLRRAYAGLGNLGIGADAGQAAALLSQALVLQGRVDEAAPLAAESQELAGQNLQTAIASRAAGAEIAVEQGRLDEATELAEAAVRIAAGTDLTIDHARAASTLALVHARSGLASPAEEATAQAARLYEAKGAQPPAAVDGPAMATPGAPAPYVPDNVAARSARLRHRLIWSGDSIFTELNEPDVHYWDRRQGVQSTLVGNDQIREAFMTAMQGLPNFEQQMRVILTRGEDLVLVEHWFNAVDGSGSLHGFFVNQLTPGARLQHSWAFDSEAEAWAVFDTLEPSADEAGIRAAWVELEARVLAGEIGSEPDPFELDNAATRHIVLVGDLVNAADWDGALAQFTDDYDSVDARQMGHPSVGAKDRIDALQSRAEFGLTVTVEPVAIRGDRLAVVSWRMEAASGFVNTTLIVGRTAEDGRSDYSMFLGEDDIRPALDELNRLYVEGEGADFAEPIDINTRFRHANENGDVSTVERLVDPDGVFVDHQRLKTEVPLLSMLTETATEAGFLIIARRYLRISPTAILLDFRAHSNAEGRHIEQEPGLSLMTFDEGRFTRLELFYADDQDLAIRRFEELTRPIEPATSGQRPLANRATEAWFESRADQLAGNYEVMLTRFHPDVVFHDLRHLRNQQHDLDALRQYFSSSHGQHWATDIDAEVLAIRDDHLCLIDFRAARTDDDVETRVLAIVEVDDQGLITRGAYFEPDARRGAIDLLLRWWAEGESPERAEIIRLLSRSADNIERGNGDALAEDLAADFQFVDHRDLGLPRINRSRTREATEAWNDGESRETILGTQYHRLTENGSVSSGRHVTTTPDGFEAESDLVVLTMTRDGKIARSEWFDGTDVERAVARFDELTGFVDGGDVPRNRAHRVAERYVLAVHEQRFDDLDALLSPAAVQVDHRPMLTAEHRGPGEIAEASRAGRELQFDPVPSAAAVRGDNCAIGRVDFEIAGFTSPVYVAYRIDSSGLMEEMHHYGEDQLAEAQSKLDELWFESGGQSADPMDNLANGAAERWLELVAQGRFDRVHELWATDHTIHDHRGVGSYDQASLEQINASSLEWAQEGAVLRHEALASRGAYLALRRATITTPDGFEVNQLVLGETDDEGRFVHMSFYGNDDMPAAMMELSQRWLALPDGPPSKTFETLATSLGAFARGSESCLDTVTDDFLLVDHDPMGFGALTAEQFWAERHSADPTSTLAARIVYFERITEHVALFRSRSSVSDDTGVQSGEWDRLNLVVLTDDGLIARQEWFHPDDRQHALDRFDHFCALHDGGGGTTLAERASSQWFAWLQAGELDRYASSVRDDFEARSSRLLSLSEETLDKDAHLEILGAFAEVGFASFATTRSVTRGERLILRHDTLATHEGSELTMLMLAEVDSAGWLTRLASFESDQLGAALRLLRDWWLEGEGAPFRSIVELTDRVGASLRNIDGDGIRDQLADSFTIVDRRSVGFGELTIDQYLDSLADIHGQGSWRTLPRRYVRLSEHGLLLELESTVLGEAGAAVEGPRLVLFTVADGLADRMEWFDVDDIAAAEARFDELTAPEPLDTVPARTGTETSSELVASNLIELANGERWDEFEAAISPDLHAVSTRLGFGRTEFDRALTVAGMKEFRAMFGSARTATIAVRGDRISLHRLSAEDSPDLSYDYLHLQELENRGLVHRMVGFDATNVDEAMAVVDEWYADSLGDGRRDVAQVSSAVVRLLAAADFDTLETLLRDDLVSDDHRAGSFGTQDKAGLIERWRSLLEVVPDVNLWVSSYPRLFHDGAVGVLEAHDPTTDSAWSIAVLMMIEDRLVTRIEFYEPEDLDRALASLDEQTTADTGIQSGRASADASDWEIVCRLGDTITIEIAHDRSAVRVGSLTDGRPEHAEYGYADFMAAQRRAIELWYEMDPDAARARGVVDPLMDIMDALYEHEWERARALLAPDFALTVAKNVTGHEQDADGFIESMRTWLELAGDVTPVSRGVLAVTDNICVFDAEPRTIDASGIEREWRSITIVEAHDGLITRWEEYDLDNVDAALARFDELTAADDLVNRATQTTARAREAFFDRDLDGLMSLFHHDVVLHDRRPMFDTIYTRDEWQAVSADLLDHDELAVSHTEIRATRGESLCLQQTTSELSVEGFVQERLSVCEVDGAGLITRYAYFDPEQGDEAFALLVEWHADRIEIVSDETTAVRRFREMGDAVTAGDFDRLSSVLAPDFHARSTRVGVGGAEFDRHQFIAGARDSMEIFGEIDNTIVAVRGDRISLHRFQTPSETGWDFGYLHLQRVNDSDLIHQIITFDRDDEAAAIAALDEWYAKSLPAAERLIFENHLAAMAGQRAGDEASIRTYLHPEFTATDHRPAGWGRVDLDGWVELQLGFHRVTTGVRNRLVTIDRISATATVAEMQIADDNGNEWSFLGVFSYRDALGYTADFYETTELDTARARFDQLARATPVAPQNRALQAMSAYGRALFEDRDLDAAMALWHPNGFLEDHTLVPAGRRTVEDMRPLLRDVLEHRMIARAATELRASRLDRLCLASDTVHFTVDGITEPRLTVVEVDEVGLVRRAAMFEPEAESRAYDTLDLWFAESLTTPEAELWAALGRAMAAQERGDAALNSSVLAADFVAVDHRSASFGTVDASGWIELQTAFPEVADGIHNRLVAVHAMSDAVLFVEPELGDRNGNEWRTLAVFSFEGAKLAAAELFDTADFDRARARFDELTRPSVR